MASSQLYEVTKILDDQSTFTASQVNPTKNPLSVGMAAGHQIRSLEFTFVGTLTSASAPSAIKFKDQAEWYAALDALISNVRFYSSAVNDCVRNLSLSECAQIAMFTSGADSVQTNLPYPGQSKSYSSGDEVFINLSIPFRIGAASAIGSSFAPLAGQFPDGGLSTTFGSGVFTGDVISDWTFAGRSTWRVRGPVLTGADARRKISPICYEKYVTSGIVEMPEGAYVTLLQNSDTPNGAYGTAGGASAGMRVEVDGETVIQAQDYAPVQRISDFVQQSSDPGTILLSAAFGDITAAGSLDTIYDRIGLPVFNFDYSNSGYFIPSVEKRLVIEQGQNLTTTNTNWLAARVRPISNVGDTPSCPGAASGARRALPLPDGSAPPALVPVLPESA